MWKQNTVSKMLATQHCRTLVAYPGVLVADGELQLAATEQHHMREYLLNITSTRKDQNSKFEVHFYWMCIAFAPWLSWTMVSQGPSIYSQTFPTTLTSGNHWSVLYHFNFSTWRVLYKWNYTLCYCWFILLSIMSLKSIQYVVCFSSSFHFNAKKYTIV